MPAFHASGSTFGDSMSRQPLIAPIALSVCGYGCSTQGCQMSPQTARTRAAGAKHAFTLNHEP